jgi:hypothetical protein
MAQRHGPGIIAEHDRPVAVQEGGADLAPGQSACVGWKDDAILILDVDRVRPGAREEMR